MNVRTYRQKGVGILREEIILTREEQEKWYSECVLRILKNTRFVLDNLEKLPEFKVNWENYHKKKKSL